MNIKEDVLKRILLNMKYDSKNTLKENEEYVDVFVVEQVAPNLIGKKFEDQVFLNPNVDIKNLIKTPKKVTTTKVTPKKVVDTDVPKGRVKPEGKNQIIQFQRYIYLVVDKHTPNDVNKKVSTQMCDKPCFFRDAIKGKWDDRTKKLWTKYGEKYKEYNKNWWADNPRITAFLLGITTPQGETGVKSFQNWYFTEIEKPSKDTKGLYKTLLCPKPCTKEQALDGKWGKGTKVVWEKYKKEYKKINKEWFFDGEFDKGLQDLRAKQTRIAKIFLFDPTNPSGYDGTTPVPSVDFFGVIKNNLEPNEWQAKYKISQYGWNNNIKIFPYPKKYKQEDINLLVADQKALDVAAKKQKETTDFDTRYFKGANVSDRLGRGYGGSSGQFDTQMIGMGIKPSYVLKREEQSEAVKKALGTQYKIAKEWNTVYDEVMDSIAEKCSRPLKLGSGKNGYWYVNPGVICNGAGGLWVWNAGQGPKAKCGCRYNRFSELSVNSIFEFIMPNGKKESFTLNINDWFAWQTPGGGMDNKKYEKIHNVLTVIELGAMAVSFFSGPFAPVFQVISFAAGVGDSLVYYEQGDKYMGTLMLVLNVVGADEIFDLFKGAKTITKAGKEGIEELAEISTKRIFNAGEKALTDAMKKEMVQYQAKLAFAMTRNAAENFIKNFTGVALTKKWGWNTLFTVYYRMNKLLSTPIKLVIKFGGAAVSVDILYLLIYGNDEDRKYSALAPYVEMLYGGGQSPEELKKNEKLVKDAMVQMGKELEIRKNEIVNSQAAADGLIKMDWSKVDSQSLILEKIRATLLAEGQLGTKKATTTTVTKTPTKDQQYVQIADITYSESIPIEQVKEQNKVITQGMTGETITLIQNMLNDNGYKAPINGVFDYIMAGWVTDFQTDNNLTNKNGTIDKETLSALEVGQSKNKSCTEQIQALLNNGFNEIKKSDYMLVINEPQKYEGSIVNCNNKKRYFMKTIGKAVGGPPIYKTMLDVE
jgi:hypothetical protein